MTQTTVATKVHQTLDAQGDFTAQITFNDKFYLLLHAEYQFVLQTAH